VKATEMVNQTRERIARFVGASSPDEIVFTKNTTEAINLVAQGMKWSKGDEIVVTTLEHQSNIMPWMKMAQDHELVIRFAEADKQRVVSPENLEALVTKRTRIISVAHVSNVYGTIQPVDEIGTMAEERGVPFLIDMAQSAGRMPLSVSSSRCVFGAFCGRKALMGPQGIGFLYGRRDVLQKLDPLTVGSLGGRVTSKDGFEYLDLPYRFEAGVVNTAGIVGLGAAVAYIEEIGLENIRNHIMRLTDYLTKRLGEVKGVSIYSPSDAISQAGIISWNLDGVAAERLAVEVWKARRVAVASGEHGSHLAIDPLGVRGVVRTSVHYFNVREDTDALVDAVEACSTHCS
jgi:cysteine desulfurase/selenocysteine lyase